MWLPNVDPMVHSGYAIVSLSFNYYYYYYLIYLSLIPV